MKVTLNLSSLIVLLFQCSIVFAQNFSSPTTTSSNGFDTSGNHIEEHHESWLKSHNRFVFIIIIALLLVAVLIWYITRSIRSMRQKLSQENQQNMMMIQNTAGRNDISETISVPSDSFHKLPEHASQQQQQQQYTHRY
jgi:NADH:ubiquinone oxidoreductase subunit 5 (subunit L)/multisubunit Na+/H+ antiporter MnhA subunit